VRRLVRRVSIHFLHHFLPVSSRFPAPRIRPLNPAERFVGALLALLISGRKTSAANAFWCIQISERRYANAVLLLLNKIHKLKQMWLFLNVPYAVFTFYFGMRVLRPETPRYTRNTPPCAWTLEASCIPVPRPVTLHRGQSSLD